MMVKRSPNRPIVGGTNYGQRPLHFSYWRTGYGQPPTAPLDFYVAQAGEYHCKPGYYTDDHELSHQTQLIYHLSGVAHLSSQQQQTVTAGAMILLPPGQPFSYSAEQPIKFHWIGLEGDWPRALGQPQVSYYPVGPDAKLEEYFVEIREILILRKPGHALQTIGVLYQLLARLEELSSPAPAPESAYPETVRRAITSLRENYIEPFDAAATAHAAGVSSSHLRALFEKWVGESPKRFHTRCRIDQARRLLTEQRLSVFEAGYHVGFDDVHHFSKVFKQITGLAPSHYQESAKSAAKTNNKEPSHESDTD